MAGLMSAPSAVVWLEKRLPDSLFGRLALLLVAVAIASHVLALSLLFELKVFPPPPNAPATVHAQAESFAPPTDPRPAPPIEGLLLDIGVRLCAVLLAAWVGARWLAAPMHRLAQSTRELAGNIHRPPIAEQGSRECREATGVINQLQAHIRNQLQERDQFVAAVSHDLRTPLTRLALRVESLEHAHDRQQLGKDIAEMDRMIRATLDHLMGTADAEPWVTLDVRSLVESQVHDSQDCGHAVTLLPAGAATQAPFKTRAQLSALRRCVANVLENAVRYGGGAEVALLHQDRMLCVRISDRGPGIPGEALAKVLLPFYRVESSRNRHTGGVGLGLATAHDIAKRHGGNLVLSNRPGGGLQADLLFTASA